MLQALFLSPTGYPPDQQRLVFGARELDDSRTLGSYRLRPDDTVHLVLRLRGGCALLPQPRWLGHCCACIGCLRCIISMMGPLWGAQRVHDLSAEACGRLWARV